MVVSGWYSVYTVVEGQREEKAKKVTAEWGAEYMIQFLAMVAFLH